MAALPRVTATGALSQLTNDKTALANAFSTLTLVMKAMGRGGQGIAWSNIVKDTFIFYAPLVTPRTGEKTHE